MKIIQSKKENNTFWQEIKYSPLKEKPQDNIIVSSNIKYQTIVGFGGAFTESAAYNYFLMDKNQKNEVLKAYFSQDGLNYNLGRLHINSCDFSLNNYSYVEENDMTLASFSLKRDEKYVLPFLKDALKITNNNINLLASPWSPPAYMKDNNNMNFGGILKDNFKKIWANYYIKYLDEMAKRGIKIKALTVQNEPLAKQTWDSCLYSATQERDFIKFYLGPALEKSNHKDIHLYIWDHNRGESLLERVKTVLSDPLTNKYVYGIAFHWYCSEDFNSLSISHNMFPDKNLLFTEGCVEYNVYGNKSKMSFENGEFYAHHMINDFNNYSTGFIDWNLILDEIGGPNHVKNYCEAPIMYDTHKKCLYYNTPYYYIGHFSKYIKENAKRINTIQCHNKNIEAVSFLNPDNEKVVVILNKGIDYSINLVIDEKDFSLNLPAHSITTILE